ncbi:PglZ domain-containing protein [Iodidimonas sp. SYSU 1G8]|uniref:PglZ domain-containing protein n=1 Tax=Iodidimonas sp. SYSU 1G8 TaxID=3133967 RepID=UPI0031FEE738
MSLRSFFCDHVLRPRLAKATCLVVYDLEQRYGELCQGMASDTVAVVDASASGIESREAALQTFMKLGQPRPSEPKALLIYVPARLPTTDEERANDPFSIFAVGGAVFPDGAGDEYLSLCLRAKPDHATEIRRLFDSDPSPSFELVDNIGGGVGYPVLRTILGVESARDILLALLAPSQQQLAKLKEKDAWVSEVRALLAASLGLKLATRGKTWSAIADELWRFLLFSEFVFDLPAALPANLASVPRGSEAARPLVEYLCDTLRQDTRRRQSYIERAEEIEGDLGLVEACAGIFDLGIKDTFPFEERTFLAAAVNALKDDRLDDIRDIVTRHRQSVWLGKGESQAQWQLVTAALQLVEECQSADASLADRGWSMDALLDHYGTRLREVDRLQREFEQAVGDYVSHDPVVDDVVDHARQHYAKVATKIQTLFTRHLPTAGWPPQGRLANADVFDRIVAPILAERGRRLAYILVDALRYELGVVLHRLLMDAGQADLVSAYAQVPTITPVGMASLLPGAGAGLSIARENGGIMPKLDGNPVATVPHRMGVLRARFGDRFAETTLSDFIGNKKSSVAETVDLLVLRSTEIDSLLETNPESTLGVIGQTLNSIRVAIHRLKERGFTDAVIVTDHGFYLNAHGEAGDLCARPPGSWLTIHDRALLGDGAEDAQNFALPAARVGIRGDFGMFAGPRTMAPYRRGLKYFHGGLSLQEAVVPVLTVRLKPVSQAALPVASVKLIYKNGATRVTTRLPVVDLLVESADMFSQAVDFEILLEAQNRKGDVVGEAKRSDPVDPATGTLTLKPGQREQVAIRMDMEFHGKFTLKALNPVTMAAYATLELETDYAV